MSQSTKWKECRSSGTVERTFYCLQTLSLALVIQLDTQHYECVLASISGLLGKAGKCFPFLLRSLSHCTASLRFARKLYTRTTKLDSIVRITKASKMKLCAGTFSTPIYIY